MKTLTKLKTPNFANLNKVISKVVMQFVNFNPTTNSYTNDDGVEKEKVRVIMVEAIINSLSTIIMNNNSRNIKPILSLPAAKFKIEKMLINLNKRLKFVCCEQDKETYIKMNLVNAIDELFFDLRFTPEEIGGIGSVIQNAPEESFLALILDYCGWLSTCYKDVSHAMRKNLVPVGGIIALTVNDRGDVNKGIFKDMLDIMPNTLGKGRLIEHCVNTFIISEGNCRYSIVSCTRYHDLDDVNGKTKGNMLLYIIRRNK